MADGTEIPVIAAPNGPQVLVSFHVLQKLAKLLPTADLENIKHGFIDKFINKDTLAEVVEEAKEFVQFHESVNIIQLYTVQEGVIVPNESFQLSL